jgi:hypothetical protein
MVARRLRRSRLRSAESKDSGDLADNAQVQVPILSILTIVSKLIA